MRSIAETNSCRCRFLRVACVSVGLSTLACGSVDFGQRATGQPDAPGADVCRTDAQAHGPMLVQCHYAARALQSKDSAMVTLNKPLSDGDLWIATVADSDGLPTADNLTPGDWSFAYASTEDAGAGTFYRAVTHGLQEPVELSSIGGGTGDEDDLRLVVMEWSGLVTDSDPKDVATGTGSARRGTGGMTAEISLTTTNANDLVLLDVSSDGIIGDPPSSQGWTKIDPLIIASPASQERIWWRIAPAAGWVEGSVPVGGAGWDAVIAAFKTAP